MKGFSEEENDLTKHIDDIHAMSRLSTQYITDRLQEDGITLNKEQQRMIATTFSAFDMFGYSDVESKKCLMMKLTYDLAEKATKSNILIDTNEVDDLFIRLTGEEPENVL